MNWPKYTIHWQRAFLVSLPLALITVTILLIARNKNASQESTGFFKIPQEQIYFLEDHNGQKNIEEIQNLPVDSFRPLPTGNAPNFGFSTSTIWLRFDVPAFTLAFKPKVLEVKNPLLNEVDLFWFRGDEYMLIHSTGDEKPYDSRMRNHRNFQFNLVESERGVESYLLKVRGGGEQLLAPISVMTREAVAQRDREDQLLRGSYFGIILFVLLFNLFIYAIIKERSSLYYVHYNLFLLLLQLSLGGFAFQYLWPESPYLANIANPLFASLSVFALLRFSQYFLDLKTFFPKTNTVFHWVGFLMIANAGLAMIPQSLPFVISVLMVNVTALLLNLAIIPIAILVLRKNFKPAKFFLVGFLLLVLTVFGFIATNAGLLQSDFYADYGLLIGSAAEVVLLSLAIVDRFKQFKDEALLTLRKMNILQKEQNVVLEKKVIERTAEINMQKTEIEIQKEEILSSIRYAERIQKNVLPSEEDVRNIFPQSYVIYRPKDIVSGDFYWAGRSSLNGVVGPAHEVLLFASGDCTGHGVPGAMVSILGCNLLRETVNQHPEKMPHSLLQIMDQRLVAAINGNAQDRTGDGMDISLWALQTDSMELRFSGANSNIMVWRRGEWIELRGTKRPLGLRDFSRHQEFDTQTIKVEKEDIIYSWTDGITDQFGGPKGKKLKTSGLISILNETATMKMSEQREVIATYITNWKGTNEQTDDICFSAVKV